jgi:SAM-dependent methyltransferase
VRVVDLDRDMRDVIPTGTTPDSEFLFQRMTDCTLGLARAGPGRRVLDVASGFGQDAMALARAGAWVVGAEPSARMTALAGLEAAKRDGPLPVWVRGWADGLPFADRSFDAAICKGAIAEMARVTRRGGRVVLAIANFESLSCRWARALDGFREQWLGRPPRRGRRHYDVPQDHFTRYELDLMREQASAVLDLEVVEGISLAWGLPGWTRSVARLPAPAARAALVAGDAIARRVPSLSDVVVLAGSPRAA